MKKRDEFVGHTAPTQEFLPANPDGESTIRSTAMDRYHAPRILSVEPLEVFAAGCDDENGQSGPGKTTPTVCAWPLGS